MKKTLIATTFLTLIASTSFAVAAPHKTNMAEYPTYLKSCTPSSFLAKNPGNGQNVITTIIGKKGNHCSVTIEASFGGGTGMQTKCLYSKEYIALATNQTSGGAAQQKKAQTLSKWMGKECTFFVNGQQMPR